MKSDKSLAHRVHQPSLKLWLGKQGLKAWTTVQPLQAAPQGFTGFYREKSELGVYVKR